MRRGLRVGARERDGHGPRAPLLAARPRRHASHAKGRAQAAAEPRLDAQRRRVGLWLRLQTERAPAIDGRRVRARVRGFPQVPGVYVHRGRTDMRPEELRAALAREGPRHLHPRSEDSGAAALRAAPRRRRGRLRLRTKRAPRRDPGRVPTSVHARTAMQSVLAPERSEHLLPQVLRLDADDPPGLRHLRQARHVRRGAPPPSRSPRRRRSPSSLPSTTRPSGSSGRLPRSGPTRTPRRAARCPTRATPSSS